MWKAGEKLFVVPLAIHFIALRVQIKTQLLPQNKTEVIYLLGQLIQCRIWNVLYSLNIGESWEGLILLFLIQQCRHEPVLIELYFFDTLRFQV